MGQICHKSKEDTPATCDISTLVSEIERNHSILRLQESEVAQQSHKAAIMQQQLSALMAEKDYPTVFSPLSSQTERLRPLRPALEQNEESLSLTQDTIKGCKIECENIRMQLQTLQTKVENAFGFSNSVALVRDLESEIDSVKASLAVIHNNLTKTHKGLRSMEDQIDNARRLRQMHEAVRLQAVQQRTTRFETMLRFPVFWIENKLERSFFLWKVATFSPSRFEVVTSRPLQRTSTRISNNYVNLTDMGDEEDEAEFQVALSDESHSLVETNPLNSSVMSKYLEEATPLSKADLLRTLSDLFALKTEHDEERRKAGFEPLLFPQFFMLHFSTKETGFKHLGEIVRSVVYYQTEARKFCLLWSALLHLDSKTTALTQISKNITLVLAPFRECAALRKTKSTGQLDDRIYLSDAISLLNDRLARDPKTGEEVITLMKPPKISDLEFTLFKLLHCMRQQNVNSLGLFRHVDRAGKGKVEIGQLAKGIKDCLEAWVPEGEIVSLLEHLDTSQCGEVSRLQFLDLNHKQYTEHSISEEYTISLQTLLYCLIKAGFSKAQKILDQLKNKLQWSDADVVSKEEFSERIESVYPEYSSKHLEKLWALAVRLSGKTCDSVVATIALRVLLRYPPRSFCDSVLCIL